MAKYSMTVHEGLAELKVLAARIEKELNSNVFINCNKHANTKIEGKSIEDYNQSMKSALQKVEDLIKRRNAIKKAITKSNAVTPVTLTKENGTTITMTVAELIEYKNVGLTFVEMLVNTLANQFKTAISRVNNNNSAMEDLADRYVTSLFGNKEGIDGTIVKTSRDAYIAANTTDLLDPNNLKEKIEELRNELDFYNTKVDAALSTSNAVTVIEFEC